MPALLQRFKQWLLQMNHWLSPEFTPVYRLVEIIKTEDA